MELVIPGRDYTSANLPPNNIPNIQLASYITGTPDVKMTPAQLTLHPGIVQIDQSPFLDMIDERADVLDFENGAATLADLAPWVKAARLNYVKGVRPGQREPTIYMSQDNVTPVVNALIAGGVNTCNLWIAHFGITREEAVFAVATSSGPFPVVAFQYADDGSFDADEFSQPWLRNVSLKPPPPPPPVVHGVIVTPSLDALAAQTTGQTVNGHRLWVETG